MIALLLLLSGCGGGGPSAADWVEGDYQLYTLAVDDACLDGAFEAIFMPSGPETEWAFEFPIFIPHPRNTPTTYDVDFREPFVGMPVNVDEVDDHLEVRGSVMESVQLNESQYGDCVGTMSVDADMYAYEAGTIAVDASISVSNLRGEDGRCPALDADPCSVMLDIRADVME